MTEKFTDPYLVDDKSSIGESSFFLNFDFYSILYYLVDPKELGACHLPEGLGVSMFE